MGGSSEGAGLLVSLSPEKRSTQTKQLLNQPLEMYTQYATSPILYDQHLKLQAEFDLLSTSKFETQLLKT